jgi:hypothetical protein
MCSVTNLKEEVSLCVMIIILSTLIPFLSSVGVAVNFQLERHNSLQHTLHFITIFI